MKKNTQMSPLVMSAAPGTGTGGADHGFTLDRHQQAQTDAECSTAATETNHSLYEELERLKADLANEREQRRTRAAGLETLDRLLRNLRVEAIKERQGVLDDE